VSTPPEQGQPVRRPVLEPTYVMRRRRTEALADLVREFREHGASSPPEPDYEPIAVHTAPATGEHAKEDSTEELPPVPSARGRRERPADDGLTLRRAAIVVGVTAAALIGFGAALVLPGQKDDGTGQHAAAPPPPATSAPATSAPAQRTGTDPDGAGTLREGDSGPQVTELQKRLLRIPNVYQNGATDGRYNATLAAAVARFQLWYGIRGDETGVYGNDTRKDLESRTTL
jgi:hypothetical protein